MQYMLLIYEDERIYGGPEKTGPALQEMVAKHMAFAPSLGSARVGGAGLKGTASATTVRASSGKRTVHDGPFAETKEQLGGFYLVDGPGPRRCHRDRKENTALAGWCGRGPAGPRRWMNGKPSDSIMRAAG